MATVTFKITHDDLRPALERAAKLGADSTRVMRSMGTTFKSLTEGTFNSVGADFRPKPWAPKWGGQPSNLQKSTTMAKSFHLRVGRDFAALSNPMPYAAIHQFGGAIKAKPGKRLSWVGPDGKRVFAKRVVMPARPFFPVAGKQLTQKAATRIAAAGMRTVERIVGSR